MTGHEQGLGGPWVDDSRWKNSKTNSYYEKGIFNYMTST